nr:hypothetical protein CFP56_42269 [Quercus suber]
MAGPTYVAAYRTCPSGLLRPPLGSEDLPRGIGVIVEPKRDCDHPLQCRSSAWLKVSVDRSAPSKRAIYLFSLAHIEGRARLSSCRLRYA